MFRKKWVEILVTDDRTAFFAAKNALEAKNIPYRTDVMNRQQSPRFHEHPRRRPRP